MNSSSNLFLSPIIIFFLLINSKTRDENKCLKERNYNHASVEYYSQESLELLFACRILFLVHQLFSFTSLSLFLVLSLISFFYFFLLFFIILLERRSLDYYSIPYERPAIIGSDPISIDYCHVNNRLSLGINLWNQHVINKEKAIDQPVFNFL